MFAVNQDCLQTLVQIRKIDRNLIQWSLDDTHFLETECDGYSSSYRVIETSLWGLKIPRIPRFVQVPRQNFFTICSGTCQHSAVV
jgi:hypothetical protein